MGKRIVLYGPQGPESILQRCALGIVAAFGFDSRPLLRPSKYFEAADVVADADMVVIRGMREACPEIARVYADSGVPVIISDAGLYPGNTEYQRLSLGSLNWIPAGPREEDRAIGCGLIYDAARRMAKAPILMLGQVPNDQGHMGVDVQAWEREALATIRRHTTRKVIWRPHPLHRVEMRGADMIDLPPNPMNGHGGLERGLEAAVREAWAVVTFNSSAALEAIRLGVPVFCDISAPWASLAYCNDGWMEIDKAKPPADPQPFLNRVAFAQWTLAEHATAEPWEFLASQIVSITPEKEVAA